MNAQAKSTEKINKGQDAPGRTRASVRQPPALQSGLGFSDIQQTAGNLAVQRELQSDSAPAGGLTLRPPSLAQPGGALPARQPDPGFQLRLTPEFRAMALQHVQGQLDPTFLASILARARLGAATPPPPNVRATGSAGPIGPPAPPTAPTPPQSEPKASSQPYDADPGLKEGPGTATDILDAAKATPEVQQALAGLATKVHDRWSALGTGEQIGVISVLAMIGGSGATVVLTDTGRRQWAFDQLNGRIWPVPGVNWLRIELNVAPTNLLMGIHIDVGALLPPSWGFAPSAWSPGPLGRPPSGDGPVAGQRVAVQSRLSLAPLANEDVGGRVRAAAGGGSALDSGMQDTLGTRLGADLTRVRIHTDSEADHLARSVNAVAFTSGQDIFFRSGAYDPKSSFGLRLLAHETIHTVQQMAGPVAGTQGPSGVSISDPADRFEQEAHQVAERVVADSGTATVAPWPRTGPAVTGSGLVVSQAPAGQVFRQPQQTATAPTTLPGQSALPPAAAPGSAAAATSGAFGAPTTGHRVEASVMLPAGQSLKMVSGSPPKEIHTKADVTVRVLATAGGISVSFSPGMVISTRNPEAYIPDVDIQVAEIGWSYGTPTQQLGVTWTARNIVNWIGNPGGDIIAAMSAQWATLPARMQKPGYDPFSDPSLPGDLITFARSLATTGGGSSAPKVLAREVEVGLVLPDEFSRDAGSGAKVVIPKGSRISLQAFLDGDLTASPPVIKVTSITLGVSGQGPASVELRAVGQDWPVVAVSNVRVAYGGHITVNYRILHEALGSVLLEFLAAAVVQENPLNAGRMREDLTVKDAATHKLVDQMVSGKLEPIFADIILANAGAVPGINLLDVFGIPTARGGAGR